MWFCILIPGKDAGRGEEGLWSGANVHSIVKEAPGAVKREEECHGRD